MPCFRKTPGAKKFMDKRGGGVSRLSIEKFLSHRAEKLRRGWEFFKVSLIVNLGYRKKLNKRGGSIKIFRRIFLSHSAEKFRRGTFWCFTSCGYRKSLDKRGGGEYQDFQSKFFCLTVPKI